MLAAASRTDPSIRPSIFRYPLGVWVLLAALAIANGVFRETVLVSALGEDSAHLLSTAILVGVILVVSYVYFSITSIEYTVAELSLVGVGWSVLTVGFEFLVGYLEGTPVEATLAQYDVLAGQVWIAVPLTLLVAPLLFGWLLAD